MPFSTDIQLAGIALSIFQCNLNCLPGVGFIGRTEHNVVSVAAPSLGIPGQLDGQHFGVCTLDRLVNSIDLPAAPVRELRIPILRYSLR